MQSISAQYDIATAARQRGIGLIEILVAVVILAVGFLALAALQGTVTLSARGSGQRHHQLKLAAGCSGCTGRADALPRFTQGVHHAWPH